MLSAIEDLPVRSMVMVSSAFMSSRRARTKRRISSASGRTLEMGSAARRAPARESNGVGRVPFLSMHHNPAHDGASPRYARPVNGFNYRPFRNFHSVALSHRFYDGRRAARSRIAAISARGG